MDVQTDFFRRTNVNAAGKPRSWTDQLLWHHAAHTVDLFPYQAGEVISHCYALQGSIHPTLGIAMDMGRDEDAVGHDLHIVALLQ
jgi:2-hydroxy-4-carboxymuconate semialdehyde hemiacetal dehydrogenase